MALLGTVLAATALTGASFTASPVAATGTRYYLALGDSVPVSDGRSSYPYVIARHYGIPSTQVVDIACSGATTASMISEPPCVSLPGSSAPLTSQLQEAVLFLQKKRGSVALVTIDIGGNDFLPCVNQIGVSNPTCVKKVEKTTGTNLKSILKQLHGAAGSSVSVVGMNYYDPWLGNWLAGGTTKTLTVKGVSTVTSVDAFFPKTYANFKDSIADVETAFQTTDLTDLVSSRWGQVPVSVDDACSWLDISCSAGHLEGFGDDPNKAGAVVIAKAFEKVIGKTLP
jgi:hypothetical protein